MRITRRCVPGQDIDLEGGFTQGDIEGQGDNAIIKSIVSSDIERRDLMKSSKNNNMKDTCGTAWKVNPSANKATSGKT